MIKLSINKEYQIPKCYKHKILCKVAVTTSKKYPKKLVLYCDKCASEI